MARGVNKAIILGYVGRDPESRTLPSGNTVVNFSIATSEQWTDKSSGERKESTEWHNCTAFGKTAEIIAEYVTKGSQLYVEGQIRTEKWQDKQGNDRYSTKIYVRDITLLGGKGGGGGGGRPANEKESEYDQRFGGGGQRDEGRGEERSSGGDGGRKPYGSNPGDDFDDDIPF